MMGDRMPLQNPILIQYLVHASGARQVSGVYETLTYVVKGSEVMVQSLSIDQPIMSIIYGNGDFTPTHGFIIHQ
jgi:hypothetical protein